MKVVIQRSKAAKVVVGDKIIGKITNGLVILLGIVPDDNIDDINWLINKIINLRIFDDNNGVMNRSIMEINGEILVVSQFTLHASTKKGNRPSYIKAAKASISIPLYNKFLLHLQNKSKLKVAKGEFGAEMQVHLINDGPVTILIDSKNKE